MSRVEIIKQGMGGIPEADILTPEDAEQWYDSSATIVLI